jgi:predicted extracellular nuclease
MPDLKGFYVQEEAADYDADAKTSEGVFVYYNATNTALTAAHVGHKVQLTGTVAEFRDMTQLNAPSNVRVITDVNDASQKVAVAPVKITLPVASLVDWEAYEGMLVEVASATPSGKLVITDNYNQMRYGQMTLTSDEVLKQFTDVSAPSKTGFDAYNAAVARDQIILDDAISAQNPTTHLGRY